MAQTGLGAYTQPGRAGPWVMALAWWVLRDVSVNQIKTMTKKQRQEMEAAILRHGEQLKAIFPACVLGPVALCKALRRLEVKAGALALHYCNGTGGVTMENWEAKTAPIVRRVRELLGVSGPSGCPVFVNGDARGYALKLPSEFMEAVGLPLHQDWGRYGILAPDFTPREEAR